MTRRQARDSETQVCMDDDMYGMGCFYKDINPWHVMQRPKVDDDARLVAAYREKFLGKHEESLLTFVVRCVDGIVGGLILSIRVLCAIGDVGG